MTTIPDERLEGRGYDVDMSKANILSVADIAKLLDVGEASVRTYRNRAELNRRKAEETGNQAFIRPGDFPPEDGRIGRSPYWYQSTINEWLRHRPGRGGHNKEAHKRNLLTQSRQAKGQ